MTLKNAALFALLAMALLTILLTVNLIVNLSGVMRGFIPPVTLLTALIQWLASLGVFVFFLVFHRAQ
jgi:membrane-associated PAP2 superfamily phosphatase